MVQNPKQIIDQRTAELLKRYMLAGGAAGASIGIGTSVANYLTYLNNKAQAQKGDTSKDDDILYVDLPSEKRANVSSMPGVGAGIAVAGGVLSMVGANAVVKSLYNRIKKKQLQRDLDESQHMYWDTAKQASTLPGKRVSTTELVTNMPVALTLLAAVASGMVTNKALSHYFPSRDAGVDPMKESKPKQVKIRYTDEPIEKVSAAEIAPAMDFVLSTLVDGLDKSSSYIPDLVHTVATGGMEAFVDNLRDIGAAGALELLKGASSEQVDADTRYLAICALNRNQETAPIIASLLEAELIDRLPYFHKTAYQTDRQDQDVVVKLAAAISDDVAEGVIDRKTNDQESGEPQEPAKRNGYELLIRMLEQGTNKKEPEKEPDLIDSAFAGQ